MMSGSDLFGDSLMLPHTLSFLFEKTQSNPLLREYNLGAI